MGEDKHRSGFNVDQYHRLTGFEGDWRDSWWDDDYHELIAKKLGLESVGAVLDVGAGVGHWGQRLLPLMGPDTTLEALDAEPAWQPKAEARAKERGLTDRYRYHVASANALPFDDATFDMVTCQTLLMHVGDPAKVVEEMTRVLAPGGLFLAAEPNNFGQIAGHLMGDPELSWQEVSDLLELQYISGRGKQALQEGWYSIGEVLPKYLHQCGLVNIDAKINNNTTPKLPPYDAPFDRVEYDMARSSLDAGNSLSPGDTYDNALRMFLAGGGTEERFVDLRAKNIAHERRTLKRIDEGMHMCAGGHLHFLVWGRKPVA